MIIEELFDAGQTDSAVVRVTGHRPDEWHCIRDGALLTAVLPYTAAQFARSIIMPNLVPPVTTRAHAVASGDASSRREAATSGASCFFMGSVTAPHLKTEGAGVRVRRPLRRRQRLAELCTGFRQENAHSRFEDFYFLERPSIL
jgi:dihydroorotase